MDRQTLKKKTDELEPADLQHVDPSSTEGEGITVRDIGEEVIRTLLIENEGTREASVDTLTDLLPLGPFDGPVDMAVDEAVEALGQYLVDDVL